MASVRRVILPGSLAPLRSVTYRRFFVGQLTSAFGDGMVAVALAFAVLDVTGSTAALGWVLGIRSAFTIGALLLGGAVADRFSRRPVMVAADVIRFASQAALAALLFTGTAQLWHMLVLYAIHGACSGFFYPAVSALAPQLVPQSQLQQANALRWGADAAGGVAGPAAAGVILAAASPAWAIAGDSVTFAGSAAVLAMLSLPKTTRAREAPLLRQLIEGWQEFSSRSWLWISNIQAAATNALLGAPFFVAGPVIARQHLGGASAWGLIVAAGGVGDLAGGVVALRGRPRRPMFVATLLFAAFAIPGALLALAVPAWLVAATYLAASAGGIAGNVYWETTLQARVPAEVLSRVTAYDWFSSLVAQPIGFGAAGVLVADVGATRGLASFIAAGTIICLVIPFLAPVRRLEALPGEAEPHLDPDTHPQLSGGS
ncbi:MAG TPA: MFS transporter [Gaiellales bacterium]|nr:MFS transporter [Gaiellales bacterium]